MGRRRVMAGQRLGLLTPLALLGLLVGLADLSHGFAGEDDDYYMQELLTREQLNQVRVQEKPAASTPDMHEQPSQSPTKKAPKGDAGSGRQTGKTTADGKTGKYNFRWIVVIVTI